jgi:NAD+ diphosphatase
VTTPLTVYLPFNRDCLRGAFVPAKRGMKPPNERGNWLIVQDQKLIVVPEGESFRLPTGERPAKLDGMPEEFQGETLVPMQGTRLPDDLLSLGGMAMQALWWESTSGFCPRCGDGTERLSGEWGKRCPRCTYEHYPHLHPAVIVVVRDGDRVLLARKAMWAPNRYALVAGFVDNGESLEGAVAREVKEEVGVEVKDITYVGSQNWPFPSQLMVGFVATYAGGEIRVDPEELEDARWFPCASLPGLPSRHSISRFLIDNFGR